MLIMEDQKKQAELSQRKSSIVRDCPTMNTDWYDGM